MSLINNSKKKALYVQYKATFRTELPPALSEDERLLSLTIDYGKMGYDEAYAILLAYNHLKTLAYNKLMTDEIVFSLHRMHF